MTWAWLLITAGVGITVGFVYYWLGVDRTEKRFARDFDATLDAYAALKRERDALARLSNDLIDKAGVLTPAERDAFDRISAQLERLS